MKDLAHLELRSRLTPPRVRLIQPAFPIRFKTRSARKVIILLGRPTFSKVSGVGRLLRCSENQ
jgi:hypothetical protein